MIQMTLKLIFNFLKLMFHLLRKKQIKNKNYKINKKYKQSKKKQGVLTEMWARRGYKE